MSTVERERPRRGTRRVAMERHRAAVVEHGFTVLPGQVPERLRARALRAINRAMGELVQPTAAEQHANGREAADGAAARSLANGLQLPHLLSDPAILGLLNSSGALDAVTELVLGAAGGRMEAATHGQVALRFPGDLCTPGTSSPVPGWSRGWHVDGLPMDLPSMPPGRIDNFTCLVGVCLSDCLADLRTSALSPTFQSLAHCSVLPAAAGCVQALTARGWRRLRGEFCCGPWLALGDGGVVQG